MNPTLSAFLSARLIDRRGGHRSAVLAAFAEKVRINAASEDEIARHQQEKLCELLRHARRAIPFYRGRLPEADEISPTNALSVLASLPVISRAELQAEPAQFQDSSSPYFAPDATGGSTGTPMCFRVDRATQIARESSLMWADSLAGWRYGERMAMLWGSDRDVRGAMAQGKTWLRWMVENRRWFNSFDMGEARMEEFHRELEKFRPHIVVAYAGSAFLFARFLKARGIKPGYPSHGVVVSAEVCTPTMRSEIANVFGCPVFDRYGNREFGAIAAEDGPGAGSRMNAADCIVEAGGEAPGPVIVTYLHNRAMPFFRYDTGDEARFVSVGVTQRLAPVEGRKSDTIRTKDGRLIHGEYFTHLLYGVPGVRLFRFEQRTLTDFMLLVEGDRAGFESSREHVRSEIERAVGAGSRVSVELVDRLLPLASGKHRFTVSLLP